MNYEHKATLKKALISQTWNKNLAGAVVSAIEADQLKPKPKPKPSQLQIALAKEKRAQIKSGPETSEGLEE